MVVAVVSLVYAHLSRKDSDEALRVANESKDLAAEANEYSHRAEQRDTDPDDVAWDVDTTDQPGVFKIENLGTTDAHKVRIKLTIAGCGLDRTFPVIVGGENRELVSEEVGRIFADELIDFDRRKHTGPYSWAESTVRYSHRLEGRVTWQTALGQSKSQDVNPRGLMMTLGRHEDFLYLLDEDDDD